MMTLVASALAGGDCIDDADALRTGGTACTLGTFLRSFRWGGHVSQLDRVSRQLLARAWAAGAGPGDTPLTIDLDSTICETYGLDKEGARHHSYTGRQGYHPLLAIAAGTGDVLMSRLRAGRANTAQQSADLYELILNRHRSSSFVITSNRAVDEWLGLFEDPILGNSALDRLANASYQIVIEGSSYRERQSPHRALLGASREGGN